MLNAFSFLIDPPPEELIASYIQTRMQVIISDLRRALRMERMSGRKSAPHATHRVRSCGHWSKTASRPRSNRRGSMRREPRTRCRVP